MSDPSPAVEHASDESLKRRCHALCRQRWPEDWAVHEEGASPADRVSEVVSLLRDVDGDFERLGFSTDLRQYSRDDPPGILITRLDDVAVLLGPETARVEEVVALFAAMARCFDRVDESRRRCEGLMALVGKALQVPAWRLPLIEATPQIFLLASRAGEWDNSLHAFARRGHGRRPHTDETADAVAVTLAALHELGLRNTIGNHGFDVAASGFLSNHAVFREGFLKHYGPEILLDHRNENGGTLLHDLARYARAPEATLSRLMELGADARAIDGHHKTPLDVAVIAQNRCAVRVLLRSGAYGPGDLQIARETCRDLEIRALLDVQRALGAIDTVADSQIRPL